MRTLIGLGFRCDVAFQLRMHSGDNTAHFFDWLAVPAKSVIDIIDRDFDVFHPDQLEHRHAGTDYIYDKLTGALFWHQFPVFDGVVGQNFLASYTAFDAKFAHMALRFRDTVRTRPVTLVRRDITAAEAQRLEQVFFRLFPKADAQFLYLVHQEAQFTTPAGHSVFLPATQKSLGEPEPWVRILQAEGLIGEPYRLSTAEILGHDRDDFNMAPDDRFSEAELLAAVAANPGSSGLRMELARVYMGQNLLDEARAHVEQAIVAAPANTDLVAERVVLDWRMRALTAAQAAALLEALPLPHRLHMPHHHLQVLLAAGRPGRARDAANALLRERVYDGEIYALKAEACHAEGSLREAEYAIDGAIARNAQNWRFHDLRSTILVARGQEAKALRASEAALKLEANDHTRAAYARLAEPEPAIPL